MKTRSRTTDEHAARIAAAIKRNCDLYVRDVISYDHWTKRQAWLWRKAQGSQPIYCGDDASVPARLSATVAKMLCP